MKKRRAGGKKKAKKRSRHLVDAAERTRAQREVGSRLRRLRQEAGLTTTELAEQLGVSQAQVSRLETGKQGLRSDLITRVADALRVKPIYLFADKEPRASQVAAVRSPEAQYGPGVPEALQKALPNPKFRQFILQCVDIFMENEAAFHKLNTQVRKTKA